LDGYLNFPTPGDYTIGTYSDDGSLVWINDQLIVDNDGFHGSTDVN